MFRKIITGIFICSLVACSELRFDQEQVENSAIKNLKQIEYGVYWSGQPSQKQLTVLAESGITSIINLRPKSELNWDEQAWVESQGMTYIHIPVEDKAAVNIDNASRLTQTLNKLKGEAILVHCGSGNRVGALMAIDAAVNQQLGIEQSIAKGKRWGLTRLEPYVRTVLLKR